jgi:hypothetical protein
MFDVGRSMFDVQSVHGSGQTEYHTKFHTSAALYASAQSDQKRNSSVTNVD